VPEMFLQPIVDLVTGRTAAVEALARFPSSAGTEVGQVFAAAHATGGGFALEAACVRAARELLPGIPAGVDLAINVSPDALDHPKVRAAMAGDLHRVIVEVTEQPAADPARLQADLRALRERGAKIAVDDVTTGYAGLIRLAELRPDLIKIDGGAVAAITGNTELVAVVEALVSLGRRLGCLVLAEGLERLSDLQTLAALDVDLVQGWAVGTPAPEFRPVSAEVRAACAASRRELLRLEPSVPPADTRIDIHHITASLASTAYRVQLDQVLTNAAQTLGATLIGVSVLDEDGMLREIIATGGQLDGNTYRLSDFPATAAALREGVMLEVHAGSAESDPAEREVLRRLGMASLLLVPLIGADGPLGVLELSCSRPRRWTAGDLSIARIVSRHVAHALARIDAGAAAHRQ